MIFVFPDFDRQWLSDSVEAQVIWGGIVKRLLSAYFIGNISAKQIWKSIHVHQSYSKPKVGRFFLRHGVVKCCATVVTMRKLWLTKQTLKGMLTDSTHTRSTKQCGNTTTVMECWLSYNTLHWCVHNWRPVYTIQPVVKPVWQPAVSCKRGMTKVKSGPHCKIGRNTCQVWYGMTSVVCKLNVTQIDLTVPDTWHSNAHKPWEFRINYARNLPPVNDCIPAIPNWQSLSA